jgi:hypothetical protein
MPFYAQMCLAPVVCVRLGGRLSVVGSNGDDNSGACVCTCVPRNPRWNGWSFVVELVGVGGCWLWWLCFSAERDGGEVVVVVVVGKLRLVDESLDRDDKDDAVDAGWLVRPYLSIFDTRKGNTLGLAVVRNWNVFLIMGFSECNWSICRRSGVFALVGSFADSDQEEG